MSKRPKRKIGGGLSPFAAGRPYLWASKNKCHCGGTYQLAAENRRVRLFGWGVYVLPNGKRDEGRIVVNSELTRCKKCGDEFYTFEQADRQDRQVIKATLDLYRKRLGYRRDIRRTPRRLRRNEESDNG